MVMIVTILLALTASLLKKSVAVNYMPCTESVGDAELALAGDLLAQSTPAG